MDAEGARVGHMSEERCRGCGARLPEKPLIVYKNMPKSAQFFPTEETVRGEKGVDIVLKECPRCGLAQAAGEPVPYFQDVIRAVGVSEDMRAFRLEQYRNWVKRFALTGKRVIEIGCGAGEYMEIMERCGAETFGLEHRRESVEAGKESGHRIIEGFVENEDSRIAGAPYDGFYCMNFLEHIPQPGNFLRGIADNLSENAAGLVEVPNYDMILENALYSELIQDHLSYFTKDTLADLLRRNGFDVLSVRAVWQDYILSAEVRKRAGGDAGERFTRRLDSLKRQTADYITREKNKGKRLAVWGAGHQALANLSLLDMARHIEYVVDSAPFKQGKYTPATHIPVVAPERLKAGDVDTVIIMAGGYSLEIAHIIEREYPELEWVILGEDGLQQCR